MDSTRGMQFSAARTRMRGYILVGGAVFMFGILGLWWTNGRTTCDAVVDKPKSLEETRKALVEDTMGSSGAEDARLIETVGEEGSLRLGPESSEAQPSLAKGLLDDLRDVFLEHLPVHAVSIRERLTFSPSGFGESTDPQVQEILDSHNRRMRRIQACTIKGSCTWETSSKGWSRCEKHSVKFSRNRGRVIQVCGQHEYRIAGGTAWLAQGASFDYLDSYYLLCFALFDPVDFTDAEPHTIQRVVDDGQPAERVETVQLSSPAWRLYFDASNGRLVRMCHTFNGHNKPAVQIDFADFVECDETHLPNNILVTILDPSCLDSREPPERMRLAIDQYN